MSTDYDIHCVTCGVCEADWRDATKTILRCPNTCLDDFRGGAELERILRAHRAAMESVGLMLRDADMWRFSDRGGELVRVAEFFASHVGHDLEVRNEYGDNWAKCEADWARHAQTPSMEA